MPPRRRRCSIAATRAEGTPISQGGVVVVPLGLFKSAYLHAEMKHLANSLISSCLMPVWNARWRRVGNW